MNLEKNTFDDCFEIFIADTPESKRIHFQLRYSVYAEQVGIGYKTLFQEQMESDAWDNCAVHFLVRHKASGAWVGGLRLVFANKEVFPFEAGCQTYEKIDSQTQTSAVELSRLCVVNKPCKNELNKASFDVSRQGKSVMWGLLRAAAVYSLHHKIEHWYFEMAPALAGLLASTGFAVQQIGTAKDSSRSMRPYHLCVENVLAHSLWSNDYKTNYRLYSGLSADAFYKLVANCFNFFPLNQQMSRDTYRNFV